MSAVPIGNGSLSVVVLLLIEDMGVAEASHGSAAGPSVAKLIGSTVAKVISPKGLAKVGMLSWAWGFVTSTRTWTLGKK